MSKIEQKIEYTHFFGEMDLYLNQTKDEIYKRAFGIGEDCGYYTNFKNEDLIEISSGNCEQAKIHFKDDKVVKVERSEDDGKNWETLNFKDNLFEVSQETLKKYAKDLTYYNVKDKPRLPMAPGILIQELIKRYKIPALIVGHNPRMGHIAIETKKQLVLWRDTGVGAELMGVIKK